MINWPKTRTVRPTSILDPMSLKVWFQTRLRPYQARIYLLVSVSMALLKKCSTELIGCRASKLSRIFDRPQRPLMAESGRSEMGRERPLTTQSGHSTQSSSLLALSPYIDRLVLGSGFGRLYANAFDHSRYSIWDQDQLVVRSPESHGKFCAHTH